MRKVHLYIPAVPDAMSVRWQQLVKKIDRMHCEVRTFIVDVDKVEIPEGFEQYRTPFCIEQRPNQEPKKKSFASMWKTYILDQGHAEDEYIPKYD